MWIPNFRGFSDMGRGRVGEWSGWSCGEGFLVLLDVGRLRCLDW